MGPAAVLTSAILRTALARLPFGDPPPAPLAGAPWWERTLFESPWTAAALLAAVAVGALFASRRAGRPKEGWIAAAVAGGLALLLILTAALVTTTRERLTAATAALIDHTLRAEDAEVAPSLDPALRVTLLGRASGLTRDEVLARIGADLRRRHGVKGYRILDSEATVDGPEVARTQVHLRVDTDRFGPSMSWWRLHWRLAPATAGGGGAWRVVEIEAVEIDGVPRGTELRP